MLLNGGLKTDFTRQFFSKLALLLLIFLGLVGILWIGMAVIFFLYSRSCDKQFIFRRGKIRDDPIFGRTIASI